MSKAWLLCSVFLAVLSGCAEWSDFFSPETSTQQDGAHHHDEHSHDAHHHTDSGTDLNTTALVESGECPADVALWSAPSSWQNGLLPVTGENVTIGANTVLALDADTPALGGLTINGVLVFCRRDLHLTADWIMLHGALEIGSAAQPFTQAARLTFTGTPDQNIMDMGSRGILVMGGKLALYGNAPTTLWTKLSQHAAAGTNTLQLLDSVSDWQVGDDIIVAPTDFYGIAATERLTIEARSGSQLTLADSLQASRWGALQYVHTNGLSEVATGFLPSASGTPVELDQRAEVGHLNRSIIIESVADGHWQNNGFGAQVMIMGLDSEVQVDGVQMRRMGQAGLNGRYPFHWHLLSYNNIGAELGDAQGHVLRRSVIEQSRNRCIVIHGTNGVLVEHNICYDIVGHAVFLEDAVERRNRLEHNLVLRVRNTVPSVRLLAHEENLVQRGGSSGFWLTNPDNTVRYNTAADAQGSGFWLAFPNGALGLSAAVSLDPHRMPLGEFSHNTAHSNNINGINIDDAPVVGDPLGNTEGRQFIPTLNHQPLSDDNPVEPFTMTGINLYKNRFNFWNRVVGPRYEEWVSADSMGKFFEGSTSEGFIRRSLIVGTSLNNANDWESMENHAEFASVFDVFPPAATASYHGGVAMEHNIIVNFPFIDSPLYSSFGSTPSGAFSMDDYYFRPIERSLLMNIGNTLINSAIGRRSVASFATHTLAGVVVDEEGLLGTPGGNWVYDVPFLTAAGNCSPVTPAGLNGQLCDGAYFGAEEFVVNHANEYYEPYMTIAVDRLEPSDTDQAIGTWQVTGVPPAAAGNFMLPNMRHFAMRENGVYRLSFPGDLGVASVTDLSIAIANMHAETDTAVLAVSFHGESPRVLATTYGAGRSAGWGGLNLENDDPFFRRYTQADINSIQDLLVSAGNTYFHEAEHNLVWIKLRGGLQQHYVQDNGPFSDSTLYNKFVLRVYNQ